MVVVKPIKIDRINRIIAVGTKLNFYQKNPELIPNFAESVLNLQKKIPNLQRGQKRSIFFKIEAILDSVLRIGGNLEKDSIQRSMFRVIHIDFIFEFTRVKLVYIYFFGLDCNAVIAIARYNFNAL